MATNDKVTKSGSTKRFGTRYGRTTKERYGAIERLQKATYACPSCHYDKIKRVALGIWECGKCTKKFAGRAYTLGTKTIKLGEEHKGEDLIEVSEQPVEEKQEKEE
jgi:large subunit ribosomal protein L37Ae